MTSEVQAAIGDLVEGRPLDPERLARALGEIMDGQSSDARTAALLVALRLRGETVPQLIAAARALRARAITASPRDPRTLDTCGTGGSGIDTFNISTTAAFVVAGAGVSVAKHGNRAASSRSGSFDVLEALGVEIDLPIETCGRILDDVGIAAFFARTAHPGFRHVAAVRAELGIRTFLNLLGPLLSPVGARYQVVGVSAEALVDPLAAVLAGLGATRALVVHGDDGLDELTTTAANAAALVRAGAVERIRIDALDYGIPRAQLADLRGGSRRRERRDDAGDPRRRARSPARHRAAQRGGGALCRRSGEIALGRHRARGGEHRLGRGDGPPRGAPRGDGPRIRQCIRECIRECIRRRNGPLRRTDRRRRAGRGGPRMNILDRILAHKADELRDAMQRKSASRLAQEARSVARPVVGLRASLLACAGVAVIAEIKRMSPSKGVIRADFDAEKIALAYQAAGAAGISVLTDERFFGGSLEILRQVRAAVAAPLLRKDFVIDSYQIDEARVAGADAVLLIVAALSDADLSLLHAPRDRAGTRRPGRGP